MMFLESRPFRLLGALALILLLAATLSTAASAPAEARRRDNIPPTFDGLKSAITCIPGPVGGGRTSSYNLSWDPATDNVTPQKRIVYDVYQAETSGGEDFSTPTYTTAPGATSFATPQLPADRYFYFVVRARDQAGNSDSNKVERQGQNLCV
jgi:hypothetical protein